MTITHEDRSLFGVSTFKDHPYHADGEYCHPTVSRAIADMLAGDWDLTNFRSYFAPTVTNGLDEPVTDVRERAEFLFGLSELMDTMMAIGDIEHTNDWDWYVRVECFDGSMHGEYCKDGVLHDHDDPIWGENGDGAIYCDTFRTTYTSRSDRQDPTRPPEGYQFYQHMGVKPEPETYYDDLEIVLELWGGADSLQPSSETLKVKDIKRITISEG